MTEVQGWPPGRIVLVTGGARGVGRTICRRFVRHGDHVIVNYFHSPEAARQLGDELREAGGSIELLRASVARRDQVTRLFDTIRERHGRLDVLINNAASGALLPLDELEDAHWQLAFDTNVRGALWCSQQAAALMPDGGVIVNLSSLGSTFVLSSYAAVGTSKAALEALTRYLAVEYAPQGIRVNTASGSLIEGERATLMPDAAAMRRVVETSTPLERLGREDELAALVFFLASKEASWITGQVIVADGGLSLGASLFTPRATSVRPVGTSAPHIITSRPSRLPPAPTEVMEEDDAIAIVGMGLVVPEANTPDEFWRALHREQNVFREPSRFPLDHFSSTEQTGGDKTYCRASGYVTTFQPHPRLEAELRGGDIPAAGEPTALWLRHCLYHALTDTLLDGVRCLLAVGYTVDGNSDLEDAMVYAAFRRRLAASSPSDAWTAEAAACLRRRYRTSSLAAADLLPHRILRHAASGLLPDRTEMLTLDAACSSSLYSIDLGMRALRHGECDVAICGGAFTYPARSLVLFARTAGLTRGTELRAFDREASGVIFAEGAGLVLLERLGRARRHGHRVLAVLERSGLSCDGRGKAIYAPNERGQRLALQRAYGANTADVDWIIGHATGTRAGDTCEAGALAEAMSGTSPVLLSSNKALIGHTGWAAGVVSVIEAVLGLQHRAVPPQPYVSSPHPALDATRFRIPLEPTPLPSPAGRPLRAGVSGFGFGGTNAHVVISATDAGVAPRAGRMVVRVEPGANGAIPADELVMVGWAADLPGLPAMEQVTAWLAGTIPRLPPDSFGPEYPLPDRREIRLSGTVLRNSDRSQIMLLQAYNRLSPEVRAACAAYRDTVGVVTGHMGPTRQGVAFAMRCYLDDVAAVVGRSAEAVEAMQRVREEIESSVPPSMEDSLPGLMPNIIAARLANHADFHGLNVNIDTGPDGALDAVRTAERYLRDGDLDIAIVGAVNGNTTPELRAIIMGDEVPDGAAAGDNVALAEGAFAMVLTRASVAVRHGLPILARLRTGYAWNDRDALDEGPTGLKRRPAADSAPLAGTARSYLAADGLVALLSLVAAGTRGGVLPVRASGPFVDVEPARATERDAPAEPPLPVARTVVEWRPAPSTAVRVPDFAIPEQTLILSPGGVLDKLFHGSSVSVVQPLVAGAPESALRVAIDQVDRPWQHLRVVLNLDADADSPDWLLPLHDLMFVAVKIWAGTRYVDRTGDSSPASAPPSLRILVLGGIRAGVPHPDAGLFSGFVKSVSRELPGRACHIVLTDHGDLDLGLRMMAAESGLAQEHGLPVAGYCAGQRWALALHSDREAASQPAGSALPRDAVVVALGGARGLTTECLLSLDRGSRPILYVTGREPLPDRDLCTLPSRPDYLRARAQAGTGPSRAHMIAEYERLQAGAQARANLARLAESYGPNRVTYLPCDLMDHQQVHQTIETIVARHGRIDLLINGAGLHRPGELTHVTLENFRAVRDTKALGLRHLRAALAGRPPARWVNVGSVLALLGWPGEAAYCAANELLATSAHEHSRHEPARVTTIAWPLWTEAGFAAEPLVRDLLQRQQRLTGVSNAEGQRIFRAEIDRPAADAEVAYLGAAERAMLRPAIERTTAGGFFLDRHTRAWRPERAGRDGYLHDHLLDGRLVLPGAFGIAMAAEGIPEIAPGMRIMLEDVSFLLPITDRVRDRTPTYTVERDAAGARADVLSNGPWPPIAFRIVRRLTDQASRVPDAVHLCTTGRVVLHQADPSALASRLHLPAVHREASQNAFSGTRRVRLRGLFLSLADVYAQDGLIQARFAPNLGLWTAALAQFVVPALLIDALIQGAAIAMMSEPSAVEPTIAGVSRIECVAGENDVTLVERYGHDIRIGTERAPTATSIVAVAPDGRVLARLSGLVLRLSDRPGSNHEHLIRT